ncbi:neutral zinc metallopeptidase [Brevundimonas sp.]|uniref:KPN_02809 family neutral zinc metallopeptidase n=1 Tax=Brevundimonas sp. TaxID=1871086 RepID=UPI003BAB4E72
MRWQGGNRGGGGIEDRRGGGGGMVAGGGIGVAVLGLIGYFVFGIDPATTTQLASQFGGAGAAQQGEQGTPEDQAGQFVDVVGGNINDVWTSKLDGYERPKVVLYTQGTSTGCGYGQAAMGPFYCPSDSTVYLDLAFWQEMESQLGASGADFARAYVIAHEFGHHVQSLTGDSQRAEQGQRAARSEGEGNRYSVALELQADCYAGVWAANASAASNGQVAVEAGDLEEGLKTANAIGDDTLQRRGGGKVSPESFTHGSSAQRVEWLQRGYQSGDPAVCDTFAQL